MNYVHNMTKCQIAVVAVLLIFAIPLLLHACGMTFFINHTTSAPRGIYISIPGILEPGDFAAVECPQSIPEINVPEGYLLLKKAIGFPGDTYTVSGHTLTINGRVYPFVTFPYLPQLQQGTHRVPEGAILFLNDPPDSLDSRYFGPIPMDNVQTRAALFINCDAIEQFFSL